jgi:hypothetical protein
MGGSQQLLQDKPLAFVSSDGSLPVTNSKGVPSLMPLNHHLSIA